MMTGTAEPVGHPARGAGAVGDFPPPAPDGTAVA